MPRYDHHRVRAKLSELYDLSFELRILSHRGLRLVSGPKHMTVKPNNGELLIHAYQQVCGASSEAS